ncbi:hypothetical protein MTsPCn9_16640 [Croceitalea sp. MTPC9]|nr:hypothetical protein MTsPCn6_09490 [Croceitalea sp. MTPC6]GMN16728.1 hypothetical protein MTsPCn9_16640 [Croceitalea sp. MTPC9]
MNDTIINVLLGIFLGLAIFAFFFTVYLIAPLVQESIKKRKLPSKRIFKLNCLRNRY